MKAVHLSFLFIALSSVIGTNIWAQGVTVDSNDRNSVVWMGSHQTFDRQGDGKSFAVTGDGNKIRVRGDCDSFSLTGSNNTVTLDRVRKINVVGAHNSFTYSEGPNGEEPPVTSFGSANTISQRHTSEVSASAATGSGPVMFEKEGGERRSQTVSNRDVILSSGGNDLTLSGSVATLIVNSTANQVAAEKVAHIVLNGDNNHITYSASKNVGKPNIVDNGHGNTINPTE
jgi:DUF3060 family protein